MHPEVAELQNKLKEILYDCAVEIRATKAGLYLFDGTDKYELITEYGFKGTVRQTADRTDPVLDRCGRGRNAFFVNGLTTEPRFSELLYESSTDRLLAAPIYVRGKLVGMIDMRDKAGKLPFDNNDLPKATGIANRIAELFVNKNVFNLRYITLSEMGEGHGDAAPAHSPINVAPGNALGNAAVNAPQVMPKPQAVPTAAPVTVTAPPVAKPAEKAPSFVPGLATLIIEARSVAERIIVPPPPESIGDNEMNAAREVLRAMLLIPGVSVVALSAFGHMGGVQEIAARSTLSEEASNFLQSKLNIWLTKRGEAAGFLRTNVATPLGTGTPIMAAQLPKVFTAPVVAGSLRGLYLTVAFSQNPERATHELLAAFLGQLQLAIEHSMNRGAVVAVRQRVAEKLVEPDFARYPELRRHSDAVVARADGFARFLALPQNDVDTIRIAAMVHDVGMRLLDYQRLYRKPDISPDEMQILREHTAVGAALVEPLLGNEIARAVLCHHERVDGRGYPNDLHGEEIPFASRVIQICDAYETIVSTDGYHPPEPPDAAINTITRAAGSQFDGELARRFAEYMRTARP